VVLAAQRHGDVEAVHDDVDERLPRRDAEVVPPRPHHAADIPDDLRRGQLRRAVTREAVDGPVHIPAVPEDAAHPVDEAELLQRQVRGDVPDGPTVA
jgi:hypothetical protein